MKIEKFFYTEYKEKTKKRDAQKRDYVKSALPVDSADLSALDHLLPMPKKTICTLFNPKKYQFFWALTEDCITLAKELRANLLIDSDEESGCIIFVGEELTFWGSKQDLQKKLSDYADEIHLRISANSGQNSPTDVERVIQLEFWFDFFQTVVI